jgi:hypothetical protein
LIKRIFLVIPLLLIPLYCYSGNVDLYFEGGPTYLRLSNNTEVQINEYMINDYITSKKGYFSPFLGFGVGHTFKNFNKPLSVAFDVAGYYTNFATISGLEYPFANDGLFDSLNYKFRGDSYSTFLESRFAYTAYKWQPYGFVGIGTAWNRLYGYSESPSDPSLTAAAATDTFEGKTTASFAYEAGIGVQRTIFKDPNHDLEYSLSMDYRYLNLGKGKLGTTQTTNNALYISNLNLQALTLSLKVTI